jgi:hypothetical protein
MTIDELLIEALAARDRFWFVQTLHVRERTDATITLRFTIAPELFVQVFFSQRSGRLSFAFVGASGRLYGRDREHGFWHRHPFGQSEQHEPTPEGMSSQPLNQFLTEVEEILCAHDLI